MIIKMLEELKERIDLIEKSHYELIYNNYMLITEVKKVLSLLLEHLELQVEGCNTYPKQFKIRNKKCSPKQSSYQQS